LACLVLQFKKLALYFPLLLSDLISDFRTLLAHLFAQFLLLPLQGFPGFLAGAARLLTR
jgi:hypothetical protein